MKTFSRKLLYINFWTNEPLSTQSPMNHSVWMSPQPWMECNPSDKKTKTEKIWLWVQDFKNWGRLRLAISGYECSEQQGEVNSRRGLDSWGLPCFSANVLLFVSLCIYEYLWCSRIYDKNWSWPYLAIQTWNVISVRNPEVNVPLVSNFLDV